MNNSKYCPASKKLHFIIFSITTYMFNGYVSLRCKLSLNECATDLVLGRFKYRNKLFLHIVGTNSSTYQVLQHQDLMNFVQIGRNTLLCEFQFVLVRLSKSLELPLNRHYSKNNGSTRPLRVQVTLAESRLYINKLLVFFKTDHLQTINIQNKSEIFNLKKYEDCNIYNHRLILPRLLKMRERKEAKCTRPFI